MIATHTALKNAHRDRLASFQVRLFEKCTTTLNGQENGEGGSIRLFVARAMQLYLTISVRTTHNPKVFCGSLPACCYLSSLRIDANLQLHGKTKRRPETKLANFACLLTLVLIANRNVL